MLLRKCFVDLELPVFSVVICYKGHGRIYETETKM